MKGPVEDICNNPDCLLLYDNSCKKKLNCGHTCFGCKEETTCLPCMKKECMEFRNFYDQDEDSYCLICYSEALSNGPCIKLNCHHFIHHKCLSTRINNKWIGPKINFNHAECPGCKKWMEASNNKDIDKILSDDRSLFDMICKKIISH